jgi:hypothetical protein
MLSAALQAKAQLVSQPPTPTDKAMAGDPSNVVVAE